MQNREDYWVGDRPPLLDPELRAKAEALRQELETLDYPDVWVDKPGMTAEQLLALEESNEEFPEDMRLYPGQFIELEDTGTGIRMPEIGGKRIYAPEVLNRLSGEMHTDDEIALRLKASHIQAAKRGKVLVHVADDIEWKPKTLLTSGDVGFVLGLKGIRIRSGDALEDLSPIVGVYVGPRYEEVAVDDLASEHVDEEFFDRLEFHATDMPDPYVIPETVRVADYLEIFGEYFGEPGPPTTERDPSFAASGWTRDPTAALRFCGYI